MGGGHLWVDTSLSKLQEMVKDREAWRAAVGSWGRKESDRTQQPNHHQQGAQNFSPILSDYEATNPAAQNLATSAEKCA